MIAEEPERTDSPEQPLDVNVVTACADEIRRLFSLEQMAVDPYIISKMCPEMWIPIKAVMMLESVAKISRSRKVVKRAIGQIGFDYDHATHMMRPNLKIPRTEVCLRNATIEKV
jgi:hypothetical protein